MRTHHSSSPSFQVFAFEPSRDLALPYLYFPPTYHLSFHHTLSLRFLQKKVTSAQLITVSASFPLEDIDDFLWELKNLFPNQIIPLIFVVDWSQPLIQLPGTTWGERVAILHSLSSLAEVVTTLERVQSSDQNKRTLLSNSNRTVKEPNAKKH